MYRKLLIISLLIAIVSGCTSTPAPRYYLNGRTQQQFNLDSNQCYQWADSINNFQQQASDTGTYIGRGQDGLAALSAGLVALSFANTQVMMDQCLRQRGYTLVGQQPQSIQPRLTTPKQRTKMPYYKNVTYDIEGMTLKELTKELRYSRSLSNGGVYIPSVKKGSMADLSGMQPGDIIIDVNGIVIKDVKHLLETLQDIPKEKVIRLYISRSNKTYLFLTLLKSG